MDDLIEGVARRLAAVPGLPGGARLAGVDVPTIKEQGVDVELVNWRGIVAGPGLSAAQRSALIATVSKAAKSPEWAKVRQQRGWDDAYLEGDAYAAFLKAENARVKDILTTIGLVK